MYEKTCLIPLLKFWTSKVCGQYSLRALTIHVQFLIYSALLFDEHIPSACCFKEYFCTSSPDGRKNWNSLSAVNFFYKSKYAHIQEIILLDSTKYKTARVKSWINKIYLQTDSSYKASRNKIRLTFHKMLPYFLCIWLPRLTHTWRELQFSISLSVVYMDHWPQRFICVSVFESHINHPAITHIIHPHLYCYPFIQIDQIEIFKDQGIFFYCMASKMDLKPYAL